MRGPLCVLTLALTACMPPAWGAAALLHPPRRPVGTPPALAHRDLVVESDDAVLRGWLFPARGPRRPATVVYLHGSGDNRTSGVWLADRLTAEGFDVLAMDGRAHGASGGAACTYGFHEKHDVSRVLDAAGVQQAILLGVSLGGAVALQAAADDPRVVGVVAVAAFSSLEAIARDRAPAVASEGQLREAMALAEREAHFRIDAVSPEAAARRLTIPVLLVHGADDHETRPVHSQRIFAALAAPARLLLVPGAGHPDTLAAAWGDVQRWIETVSMGGAQPGR